MVTLSCDQDVSIPNHTEQNSPNGRLVKTAAAGVSETDYRYDALGRLVSSQQVPSGQSSGYIFGYGYNLAGAMTSMTYPSGRTLTLLYDAAGRADSIRSSSFATVKGTAGSASAPRLPTR